MNFPRASGILLHPTSLSGDFGIGDLGSRAYEFVDFLARAGQTYWQMLPLGPTGYGDSPYQCFSAFAGNLLLISPESLVEDGLAAADAVSERPQLDNKRVDYGRVYNWKTELLPRAFAYAQTHASTDVQSEFGRFCDENAFWLEDYSLYQAIKASQGQRAWYEWPDPLKLREPGALSLAREQLAEQTDAEKFYQFLFFRQWYRLKTYANGAGIKIIGDIPIFVAHDSCDVWCNRDQYKLRMDASPEVVAGVPPDYFCKTGQRWGNPIYNWDAMRDDGFRWWIERIAFALKTVDIARLDHFIGFIRNWEVPGHDKVAENGQWADVPGGELFWALKNAMGDLPIIAEDLGAMTHEVERLRDDFGFPGMRILQFAFGGDASNRDLPHNYIKHAVAYTGTHDNDTTMSWAGAKTGSAISPTRAASHVRHALEYIPSDGVEINWDCLGAVWASVADTAIAPMQDVLGIGAEGRMNVPGATGGNWQWRLSPDAITSEIEARLGEMTRRYGRGRPT